MTEEENLSIIWRWRTRNGWEVEGAEFTCDKGRE